MSKSLTLNKRFRSQSKTIVELLSPLATKVWTLQKRAKKSRVSPKSGIHFVKEIPKDVIRIFTISDKESISFGFNGQDEILFGIKEGIYIKLLSYPVEEGRFVLNELVRTLSKTSETEIVSKFKEITGLTNKDRIIMNKFIEVLKFTDPEDAVNPSFVAILMEEIKKGYENGDLINFRINHFLGK